MDNFQIIRQPIHCEGFKFTLHQNNLKLGRARLYILSNDLHSQPFGFMEDVFVDKNARRAGYGSKLVDSLIREAKNNGCYKLIGCSRYDRPKVHDLYRRLGFVDHGVEFRHRLA